MIKLIEASNFRSLKYISQPLSTFHVLIGANATGKTTFLDVIKFMADIVSMGIDKAVFARVPFFEELTFGGDGGNIELAIEAELPNSVKEQFYDIFSEPRYDVIRYEIRIGLLPETNEIVIKDERATLLKYSSEVQSLDAEINNYLRASIFRENLFLEHKLVVSKTINGYADLSTETYGLSGLEHVQYNFGQKKSALGNLPEDVSKFPASVWLKSLLLTGVQLFILDSLSMRNPSSPGQSFDFKTDGSNLPWVIDNLKKDPKKFTQWVEHIQTALPDVEDIYTVIREEDRRRYIKVKYRSGIEVPAWLVSDGTLQILALTITAYLRDLNGLFLIEEPENGIHPKAIETVFQSLSSVYNAQVLLATHSPVILGLVKPEQLLCFSKTGAGVTNIILGTNHPKLKDWKGSPNLNLLFASGILS